MIVVVWHLSLARQHANIISTEPLVQLRLMGMSIGLQMFDEVKVKSMKSMNACTQFHDNPSDRFISLKKKIVILMVVLHEKVGGSYKSIGFILLGPCTPV